MHGPEQASSRSETLPLPLPLTLTLTLIRTLSLTLSPSRRCDTTTLEAIAQRVLTELRDGSYLREPLLLSVLTRTLTLTLTLTPNPRS